MPKKRYINTRFWSDSFIVSLNPLERYLFLYLLTNEHTDISGIYELPWSVIARETGLEEEMLKKMFLRFKSRVYYIDGWVYLRNFSKHQATNPKVEAGVKRSLDGVPDDIMTKIKEIQIGYDRLSKATIGFDIPKPKPILKPKGNIAETSSAMGDEKSEELLPPEQPQPVAVIPDLLADGKIHVQIIGLYQRAKNIVFSSREQQQVFVRRNVRPARLLASYGLTRIADTMAWLRDNADFKWTLETVGKYIDEDLSKLTKKGGIKILSL